MIQEIIYLNKNDIKCIIDDEENKYMNENENDNVNIIIKLNSLKGFYCKNEFEYSKYLLKLNLNSNKIKLDNKINYLVKTNEKNCLLSKPIYGCNLINFINENT
jgi:hypothetical protein